MLRIPKLFDEQVHGVVDFTATRLLQPESLLQIGR